MPPSHEPLGDEPPLALADLAIGATARVIAVVGDAEVRRRLLEMGLTPGVQVRVVRVAPLGDPIELAVRGYRLSVRRSEARGVLVAPSAGEAAS